MSSDDETGLHALPLDRFLAETCPDCGTPGPWRHLAVVGGCRTCAASDPRPVAMYPRAWRGPAGKCYSLPSGNTVHVHPGCRCGR